MRVMKKSLLWRRASSSALGGCLHPKEEDWPCFRLPRRICLASIFKRSRQCAFQRVGYASIMLILLG